MKKIHIPLFWKFSIAITSIVALFGSLNVFLIWNNVYDSFEDELELRGSFIASSIAAQSVTPILSNDYVALQKLVDNINKSDSNIVYAFIINHDNLIVAHTFPVYVPNELINANALIDGKGMNKIVVSPKFFGGKLIKDIAFPILDGSAGLVRVGLSQESIKSAVKDAIKTLLTIVVVFLVAGILTALLFSYIITKPIKVISDASGKIDLGSLSSIGQNRIKIRDKLFDKWNPLIRAEDELDLLANKFNGMIERLEKTYNELRSAQSSLIQSEKLASIGTLAAGIAHEMNSPVSGLQNCIRRISKDPGNIHQNKKYLGLMMDASERIERVIQNLLNYSRHQELKFENVKLTLIIENSLLLVRHKLEKSEITVQKDYAENIPEIEANPVHIEQVIVNLILNSIDAIIEAKTNNKETPAIITFELLKESDNSKIHLVVKDTGKGMFPDEVNKIFDPFYTTKSTGKGTGLGLSVSYNIIEMHKGTITAESEPGVGTKFIISLPIKQT